GILYVNDLLKPLDRGGPINAGALAREALMVPETLPADEVLAEMRRRNVREALVIDEYGGTAGLVTFASLMERIVGDLNTAVRSSLRAFAMTMIDAPVSARIAIQSVAMPAAASATNASLSTIEITRFTWMFLIVARLSRSA